MILNVILTSFDNSVGPGYSQVPCSGLLGRSKQSFLTSKMLAENITGRAWANRVVKNVCKSINELNNDFRHYFNVF